MRRAWPAALNARGTDARRPSSTSVCSSTAHTTTPRPSTTALAITTTQRPIKYIILQQPKRFLAVPVHCEFLLLPLNELLKLQLLLLLELLVLLELELLLLLCEAGLVLGTPAQPCHNDGRRS